MRIFKLNNHGWGMQEMLIMSSILFILLLIVAFYLNMLYEGFDNNKQYHELEDKLVNAAKIYDSKQIVGNRITLEMLKNEGYIYSFSDFNGNSCDGYVDKNNGNFTAYVKCINYETNGYNLQ